MNSSLIGRKLGKYEIIELLGQGGMATVYKGYQPDIDRFVAIKVLPPHPGQDMQFVDRFRLEARTIAQLQHPHILPMHDYGTEGGILYLVMAFVAGGSLKDRIAAGPMPVNEVEVLLRQVASALDYAHRRGIIHRDIKPDNVLIDSEGHAMLADFGIAKILEGETGLTTTGGVVGTPAYMAPEQGQGLSVTHQADIYSLGVIVYEMLTGRQPYSADTPMQVMLKHITDPVPSIADEVDDLPPALEPVMRRVLAKNAEDRYDSAMDFAQDFLRSVHQGTTAIKLKPSTTQRSAPAAAPTQTPSTPTQPPAAPPPPTPTGEFPRQSAANNPLVLLGGFAIIAVAMVAVVLLVVGNNNNNNNTPLAPSATAPAVEEPTSAPVVVASDPTQPATAVAQPGRPSRGRVSFGTARDLGDTVNVQVNNLVAPSGGMTYALWLQNTVDDSTLGLGALQIDAAGSGILRFTDREGRMLPALFNRFIITQESTVGDTPAGSVIYSGELPDAVPAALSEIFVSASVVEESRVPETSLFGGARLIAQTALTHTSLEHSPHTVFWLHNRTEHTVNVLRSTQEDFDKNEVAENPGFDVGLTTLLENISTTVSSVASAAAGDAHLQENTQRFNFCLSNVRKWTDDLINLQIGWTTRTDLTDEDVPAIQAEITKATTLIDQILNGVDFNENGRIENFPGECGLAQLSDIGILMGSIDIYDA